MREWIHAFRLRTLPLAASCIIVGSALAAASGSFHWPILTLALLTALLLQVLSNLSNDLGDHLHGTDNADRVGPKRAVQSGTITPVAMQRGMLVTGTLAFLSGLGLIVVALGLSITTLVFLFIGMAAIGAAVKYTFGSNPYGYAGLGDVSVFVFFGPVGVLGTYYLHTGSISWPLLLPAAAFGALSAAVLNVNNIRDIANDAASGKRTVAVRLGAEHARRYHSALLTVAFITASAYTYTQGGGLWPWSMAMTGFIPVLLHGHRMYRGERTTPVDTELKRLALGTFLTALTFSLAIILA